ncbi:beta-N-acetylhexosaminidase [Silanimonas sp.]|uniref:beta-N-acetylhexosaminidase n=1 Tax=Silanimonas sp. TaxID=1929290 RepID=UPI0022BD7196|nr:beta-N-acetylhexosaminidase [Silanimonas sp.]MCZ8166185.1 beta-N-acetylhexosaminidase [Silanimonas sp.]
MLIFGIAGTELTAQERDWLQHPQAAGVILFKRNFASRQQVTELAAAIREAAPRPQLLCVDQEGGRVQRFIEGFTKLPALAPFGPLHDRDPGAALRLAHEHAWLMASEIRAIGLDLSFAPVVDLGRGNLAIGDRAFHADPQVVAAFTRAYVQGMHAAGMAATLKHFPGHGSVLEDTHFDEAIDPRPLDVLEREDLVPFAAGIDAGAEAVMLAHVTYPAIAPEPAGYSPFWLKDVLRDRMGFRGVAFSDDIGMAAAESAGGIKARIDAHLDAGCDVVLVCAPALVEDSLKACDGRGPANTAALTGLMGRGALGWQGLLADARRPAIQSALGASPFIA